MNIEISDEANLTPEDKNIIERVNKVSTKAMGLASLYDFGLVMMGKPVLLVPRNDEQESLFQELLEVGFCHGDVEGRAYGYRATYDGRVASSIIRGVMKNAGIEPR